MRVVIFWIMYHLSLGHEKKALLNFFASVYLEAVDGIYFLSVFSGCHSKFAERLQLRDVEAN